MKWKIKAQRLRMIIMVAFIGVSSTIILSACEKEGENETNISANGLKKSHNMGQNCMNCHKSGGQGEGWFNVAGTVYDSLQTSTKPNGVVRLYTGPDGTGTLKATVYVDAKGNFYTTEAVNFSGGLYPAVTGTNGQTKYMGSTTTTGACNSCHNVSEDKIWIN